MAMFQIKRNTRKCSICPLAPTGDKKLLTVALVGQPNSGKSTFYNSIVGYKVETANYPGTTVTFSSSLVQFGDYNLNLVDLPGTYTLIPIDKAEEVTYSFLLNTRVDGIIQVAEASALKHALSLTVELLLLGVPMVLVINMMDEIRSRGMEVDVDKLSEILRIPVVPAVAIRDQGTHEALGVLLEMIESESYEARLPERLERGLQRSLKLIEELEEVVEELSACRLHKNKVLHVYRLLNYASEPNSVEDTKIRERLISFRERYEESPLELFFKEKAKLSESIADEVLKRMGDGRLTQGLDELLFHPVWGKLATLAIFLALFLLIYILGGAFSELMKSLFAPLEEVKLPNSLFGAALRGVIEGFLGGVEIVLPFALPLLLVLALFEDSGLLPRLAYVADSIFRAFGLSGRSVIPFIIGYGCTVPGIMALRSVPDERERKLGALLLPLIPCSARVVVLLALAVPLIGPIWGFSLFLLNLLVVSIVGKLLERITGLRSPGFLMTIPPYRAPSLKLILWKLYLRMKDFFTWAWPILILGSLLLEVGSYLGFNAHLAAAFKPFAALIRVPSSSTIPLLFGLLKKELAVPMFIQAVGGLDKVSLGEVLRFTIFTMFYIPCVSTIAVIWKEYGGRWAFYSSLLNMIVALLVTALFIWIP